jgi:hypothetical protein
MPPHATTPPRANASPDRAAGPPRENASPDRAAGPPRENASPGQATVEFIAALPLVAVVLAALWQLALVGYAEWGASAAARAAARASAVGGDPAAAAQSHLARSLRPGLRVRALSAGDVRVAVRIPSLPGMPGLGHARATGHFEPQS